MNGRNASKTMMPAGADQPAAIQSSSRGILSVIGIGMRSPSGVAAKMFRVLATEKINIANISTGEIVISASVPQADAKRALQALHKAFELEREA